MLNVERLNREQGIEGQLTFFAGAGGLPMLDINTPLARARISLYGGQVLAFQPATEAEDLLFLSERAFFQAGRAIKGGIPLCWPWFGPDPEARGRPAHGFVRTRHWDAVTTRRLQDGGILVRIGLVDSPRTRELWPHPFQLAIEISVGSKLRLELVTRNSGEAPVGITQALHTYLRVGDVRQTRIPGLAGAGYYDKLDGGAEKQQLGPVLIDRAVDRIYSVEPGSLEVVDESLGRRIRIASSGSDSVVVWNPWSAGAAAMEDLADDDYLRMLCVESANTKPVTLEPGESRRLGASYSLASC